MDTLEAEREGLEAARLANLQPEPVALYPDFAGIYAARVSVLAGALNEEGTHAKAAGLLRSLIEKVVLYPDPDAPNGHPIELFGELAAIFVPSRMIT